MKSNAVILLAGMTVMAHNAQSNVTTILIAGITSAYPKTDTLRLIFDDDAGSIAAPYWLNGFVSDLATDGYVGVLQSSVSSYEAPVYAAFTPANNFYLFQECGPGHRCYMALATATNGVPVSINPRIAGNLGAFFQENIANLAMFAGSNSGWNISYNTLPSFPESFPWLQVVKPNDITISSVPEPSTLLLIIIGVIGVLVARYRQKTETEA